MKIPNILSWKDKVNINSRPLLTVWRKYVIWMFLGGALLVLIWRAFDLQVLRRDFLTLQGDARRQRVIEISAHRGTIMDRYGEPLAISTPVDSIWVNPSEILAVKGGVSLLAKKLNLNTQELLRKLLQNQNREFIYVKRHLAPYDANQIMQLGIYGVYAQREYRRYYPSSEVSAHFIGFTDIDDHGQEGVELAFDKWLSGVHGLKRVMKDRLGRVIKDIESIQVHKPGQDLVLSIDKRLQYLAYRELKLAVQSHQALSGTVVMLDSQTGELLAMVNQPAFNPNNRSELKGEYYRNRAVTDMLEPGSAIKPFTMAAALESGQYNLKSIVDTDPGYLIIGEYRISDMKNYGKLDMAAVLSKSSNIGASRIALTLSAEKLWHAFEGFGLGKASASGLPGESSGYLSHFSRWGKVEQAAMAYGYGVAVTPLQLAQAYAVLANNGRLQPVTILRGVPGGEARQIVSAHTARQLRHMLVKVVTEGTGRQAGVPGYTIAGKTGTVHKSEAGGYAESRYFSIFAGMAPAENPKLVMVVIINEPSEKQYYGGEVAAPVFGKIMGGALRLLNIPPDALPRYAQMLSATREST